MTLRHLLDAYITMLAVAFVTARWGITWALLPATVWLALEVAGLLPPADDRPRGRFER